MTRRDGGGEGWIATHASSGDAEDQPVRLQRSGGDKRMTHFGLLAGLRTWLESSDLGQTEGEGWNRLRVRSLPSPTPSRPSVRIPAL